MLHPCEGQTQGRSGPGSLTSPYPPPTLLLNPCAIRASLMATESVHHVRRATTWHPEGPEGGLQNSGSSSIHHHPPDLGVLIPAGGSLTCLGIGQSHLCQPLAALSTWNDPFLTQKPWNQAAGFGGTARASPHPRHSGVQVAMGLVGESSPQ